MERLTRSVSWVPSVHLIKNIVLFATADYLTIQKDVLVEPVSSTNDQYDVQKRVKINSRRNKFDGKVSGEFLSLMLSTDKPPFRTSLTIFT